MSTIIVLALLLIVIVFGISSGLQSQAQIETAKAAQAAANAAEVSAWGNLITILLATLVVLVVLGCGIAFVWWKLKPRNRHAASAAKPNESSQFSVSDLVQLEILRTLKSMNAPAAGPAPLLLEEKHDENQAVSDDPLHWLR